MTVELSRADLVRVASLARLKLTDAELDSLTDQLRKLLNYVEMLNEVDIENVDPMPHAADMVNVLREDVVAESLPRKAALANAPKTDGQFFLVPKILEEN